MKKIAIFIGFIFGFWVLASIAIRFTATMLTGIPNSQISFPVVSILAAIVVVTWLWHNAHR
jgi:hypothetical protein